MGGLGSDIPLEQIFEKSLGAISVHTLIVDDDGRPVDYRFDAVNPAFEVLTGLKAPDIVGRTVREVLPGTEHSWIERYGQVALTGEPQSFNSYSQDLGKWFAVSAFRHKPQGFTVSFFDITATKQAELQVQRSHEQFRTMVWNMPVGVLLQGPRAEILLGNPKVLELLGLTDDQLRQRTSFDPAWKIIREDGTPFPAALQPVPEAIRTRAPVRDVILGVFRPVRGDVVWLLVDAEPLLDAAGQVEQVVCTCIDVTSRKRAQELWRESEDRLERVLDGSQLGYWDWDIATGKVHRNARWAEMLGYTLEEIELSVRQWTDLHHPDDQESAWKAIQDHLEGRTPVHRMEYRMRCKDGTYKWILDQARIVTRDANGKPLRMSGTHTDIDELKRAEAEKARFQAQLQQAQKMENLGNLAGGIAHDMNNVLAAILTLASAQLVRLAPDDPVRRSFETIGKAAQRGGTMVKSLLEFARQRPAEEKQVDLNALVGDVVELLGRTTFAKLTLETDLDPHLPPVVGDPGALTHALMNLCVNAVDAMPETGVLTVRTRGATEVVVEVQDTGTGMTPDVLERALDPFFTTKPTGRGTGLGLSLVYSTVQAHRGHLKIESLPGQGTLVRLGFPPAPTDDASGPEGPGDRSGSPARSWAILLVDDDGLIRSALEESLATLGHRVTGAGCGEEALDFLARGLTVDVVILDLNMPGLGGPGTLARIRTAYPRLPVVVSTGRADQTALDLAARVPFVSLLAKPYTIDDLVALLDRVHGN